MFDTLPGYGSMRETKKNTQLMDRKNHATRLHAQRVRQGHFCMDIHCYMFVVAPELLHREPSKSSNWQIV